MDNIWQAFCLTMGKRNKGRRVAPMSRGKLAFLIGVVGFIVYIGVVVALGDYVIPLHWALQMVYYVFFGIVWVIPAKRLIQWAASAPD